jgi:FAD/FMN-containing dehydrogenase/Fe-S oxidoreductase
MDEITPEFIAELSNSISGEVKTDPITRVLYSTDASIHQIKPLGVVFPRNGDELEQVVRLCAQYHVPLIPRGSGSSLAGQVVGKGLVIDCSRYINRLITINREEQIAVVEPGLILDDLNHQANKFNLQFGPDPASSERATLGGCIGNNATGAHSIIYGMTSDHILSAEVILADGTVTTFAEITIEEAEKRAGMYSVPRHLDNEQLIYATALNIRSNYKDEIKSCYPVTWRRVSGYNLNYLLPWSPTFPPQWDFNTAPYPPVLPNSINLAQLLAGSEGTLGVIRNATIRLVPIKKNKIISVLSFSSIVEACETVPDILKLAPSAVELIPQSLIHLARSVPAYANLLSFVVGDPAALLGVEFSGDDAGLLTDQVKKLNGMRHWSGQPYIADTAIKQKQVWDVRNVGLGILMSRQGDYKPISFIEDMSVPVEQLGTFVRELDVLLGQYQTKAEYYGHASAGCLHIRPLLNTKTAQGRLELRSIAQAAVDLVLKLGGAVSSEHGDGITRGEWIQQAYGPKLIQAFTELKQAADPQTLLNPGKKVDTPKMDSSLRYGDNYQPIGWMPVMGFSNKKPKAGQIVEAIEQCNGAGVCRKSEGVMCPSFQATKDEFFSTRGRANMLRNMISSGLIKPDLAMEAVKDTLELCLACKGCKAECPSAVDMAKLKYEFYEHYYSLPGHHHPIRDYLFGYITQIAAIGHFITPIANIFISAPMLGKLRESLLGISNKRVLPRLKRTSLHKMAQPYIDTSGKPDCLLLSDGFNEYFYPETGFDAIKVLAHLGYKVRILSTIGVGRTLISKGFLSQAKRQARKLIDEIHQVDPHGQLPVIGLEPSEIFTLRDEFLDFFPDDPWVRALSDRAYMIDEFLVRPGLNGILKLPGIDIKSEDISTDVLLHGHCYQKAQPPAKDGYPTGVEATQLMLQNAGYSVKTIKDGCCGMAGAFGYETEHYSTSMKVGELNMFPAINNSAESIICAAGISCKSQIEDGTGRQAVHPITLVSRRLSDHDNGGVMIEKNSSKYSNS